MKRQMFILLMAMMMMLGMTQAVFADEVRYFEGTGDCVFGTSDDSHSLTNVRLEYSSQYISFSFLADDVEHILLLTPIAGSGSENGLVKCDAVYDGVNEGVYYNYFDVFSISDNTVTWIKIGVGDIYISGGLNLVEVEESTDSYTVTID